MNTITEQHELLPWTPYILKIDLIENIDKEITIDLNKPYYEKLKLTYPITNEDAHCKSSLYKRFLKSVVDLFIPCRNIKPPELYSRLQILIDGYEYIDTTETYLKIPIIDILTFKLRNNINENTEITITNRNKLKFAIVLDKCLRSSRKRNSDRSHGFLPEKRSMKLRVLKNTKTEIPRDAIVDYETMFFYKIFEASYYIEIPFFTITILIDDVVFTKIDQNDYINFSSSINLLEIKKHLYKNNSSKVYVVFDVDAQSTLNFYY